MPTITVLVGPPGSGKSTFANDYCRNHPLPPNCTRISQDDQGKDGHMSLFNSALSARSDLVIDRMNFDKNQRERYLKPARDAGYATRIIVFHVSLKTCLERCAARENHPTIQDAKTASQAVNFFFSKYERVQDDEADEVMRMGWVDIRAPKCIWSDLDGTVADVEHRRRHVRPSVVATTHRLEDLPAEPVKFKPNWKAFFDEMELDPVDETVRSILDDKSHTYPIVYATGRPDNYKQQTERWLIENGLRYPGSSLFMRMRNDMRRDDIVKEIILEFEVKTKYNVFFALDDRDQVVKMLRKHGVKVLQCAEGDF
jgi:predicted kinase